MKFIDLINEDEQSEYDKIFKRTKTIFNAYRKGRIRTKSGIVFSYELPEEETHISVSGGQGTGPTGFIMSERIKIKEECEKCSEISFGRFGDFIKRKFTAHDVHFAFNVYPEDIEKWTPETINEDYISPDQEKELKKTKTIFKALKKGTITIQPLKHEKIKLRYTIGDNVFYKWEYYMGKKELTIVTNKLPEERVTIYSDNEYYIDQCLNHNSSFSKVDKGYDFIERTESKIRQKFERFNAKIHINGDMNFVLDKPEEPQPINEDESKEKLIKRGKTIYKGFKTGVIRKGHFGKIMYELPDVYDLQLDVNDEIFIKIGGNRTENEIKFYYVDGTGGEIKPYSLNNHEYHLFVREIERNKFKSFGIVIWYQQSENINEEDDKSKKKVRAVFKALNKKVCRKTENYTFYFVLPDHYKVIETDTPELETFRQGRREDGVLYVQVGHDSDLNSIKFFYKEEGDDKLNRYRLGMDTKDVYDRYLSFVNEKFKPFNIRLIYKTRTGKWQ